MALSPLALPQFAYGTDGSGNIFTDTIAGLANYISNSRAGSPGLGNDVFGIYGVQFEDAAAAAAWRDARTVYEAGGRTAAASEAALRALAAYRPATLTATSYGASIATAPVPHVAASSAFSLGYAPAPSSSAAAESLSPVAIGALAVGLGLAWWLS